jgi:phosphatidylserine/phosphatidylglycerophosphate/cardiolipin synthase-like enzyme
MTKLLIGRDYPNEIIEAVKNSKTSIKVLMYDWRWYSHQPGARIQILNQEIVKAINRGVEVRAVINNRSILNKLKDVGVKAIVTNTQRTLHIKMVIIDDQIIFIGSHNFSVNGFELNHEMSVKLTDPETISKCNIFFQRICLS